MRALVLGGTGFLGTALRRRYDHFIYWGTSNYLSESKYLIPVLEEISKAGRKITHIIDFTKNTPQHINPAVELIDNLPRKCTYVHISTYGVMFPHMYAGEWEYNTTKYIIEKSIRPTDLAVRVPLVTHTGLLDNPFLEKDISSNHIFTCSTREFVENLMKLITNEATGIHVLPSRVIEINRED